MAVNKVIDIMERVDAYAKENSNGDNPSWMYQEQLAKVMKKFADKEGTSFHAFVIEVEDEEGNIEKKIYMTNAMISDLTGIEVEALKKHYKNEDKKSELEEEEGLLELTGSVLKNEIIIAGAGGTGYNLSECYIPAKFGKSGRLNTILFKNGKEYTLNNNSQNILSLKSVMKLMLMMTNTDIAKQFRNFVIDNLVLGETAQEAADEYFDQLFDKDNIILYSNNTEKLLELLDISYKYDIMKGVILQSVDPMKDKLKRIDGFKKEFKKDIVKYESQISKYKEEDEDIFFEQINALENKIEETNRIIIALDTLAKTLLLRLNIIAKTVRKLSSESNVAKNYLGMLSDVVDKINSEYCTKHPDANPPIKGAWTTSKMNEILIKDIKLVDPQGVYGKTVERAGVAQRDLIGHTISTSWTERYSKEFINSIKSAQNRTGNDSDKYIRWTPFGIKLIGILMEKFYLEDWTPSDFLKINEGDWEKMVYDKYMEEQMKRYNSAV